MTRNMARLMIRFAARLSLLIAVPLTYFANLQDASAAIDTKPIVFVTKAALTELSETLAYPARIEPKIKASVVAEADGIIAKVITPLGHRVTTRTALFVIRNTDPIYQYSPMIVRSPVSGVVSQVDVTEGSRVSRGDKLAMVTDPDQLSVVVEVTAQDLRVIHPNQTADLMSSTPGAPALTLRVKGISPFVDPATGTAQCELELVRGAKNAMLPPPGVIARVSFRTNERKGFSVPESALTYRGKDPFVRIVLNGKAKMSPVELGRKQSGQVEILKGLKSGDVLIERSNGFIADGDAVEIQEKKSDKDKEKAPASLGTQG